MGAEYPSVHAEQALRVDVSGPVGHCEDRRVARFYRLVRLVIDLLVLRGRRDRSKDAEILVYDLIYGDSSIGENEEIFGLTTREAVKKGASVLRQIEPKTLFPGGEDGEDGWYWENFRDWREFYLEADDLGAEVLMQVL